MLLLGIRRFVANTSGAQTNHDCNWYKCTNLWRLSIMASELKVDKFTGVTTVGSIDVVGEGNSTTTNLQQGLAKSWSHLMFQSGTQR